MAKLLPLLFLLVAPATVGAQTTWIVRSGGGPGVHFTDLQSAVNAANHGDTIVVLVGPFNAGVSGFTTNKGVTIVSQNQVDLATQVPVTINGLPAGRQFRLVGFHALHNAELRIVVQNCAGEVHLEDLHAHEHGPMPSVGPSIHISNCALVTLRDVEDFGNPAVQVDNSTAVLANCRLGITTLGLGGGRCLEATDSTVDVSEPQFDTGFTANCITLVRTHLRLGGTSAALVKAGTPQFQFTGTPIVTTLGSVTVDPNVQLLASPANAPTITGTAVVQTQFVPATWSGAAVPGQNVLLHSTHPANSVELQFVGFPGPVTPTPFGPAQVALAPSPVWLVAVAVNATAGVTTTPIAIPAWAPPGIAFAAQTFVGHTLSELSTAAQFVTH